MHIPDGYLGPQTYIPFYAIMLPLWHRGSRILRKALNAKQIPLLALSAAFSFVIMMFNIPVPGGSTGHAVGSALIAILLGPWAAFMSVSMALIIQALLFGDGGITAIGANCFNIAFIMSFSGYYIYKLLSSNSGTNIPQRVFAACVAAYISINLAAFFTAVEFGIQPYIAHKPDGTPLYGPYSLDVAVPIMTIEHLAIFGFIEALVTGLVVAYIAKTDPAMLNIKMSSGLEVEPTISKLYRRLWIGLGILILLTPLGIIASGGSWGEWGADELLKMIGSVPEGFKGLSNLWSSVFPDYTIPGLDGPVASVFGYIFSAVIGTSVILLSAFVISKTVFRGR
jgi:cobalt/nickel transport system permease protein